MKRRDWLGSVTVAAVGAVSLDLSLARAANRVSRIVDAHTHFYDPTRPQGVPWPSPGTPLYRRVLPDDWRRLAEPHGIQHTVVVEASPWVEDNQWMLDLAVDEKAIVGFVGNLDPYDAEFSTNLRRFAKNPLFRGVRWRSHLVSIERDRSRVVAAARQLAEEGMQVDLNGPCEILPQVGRLASDVPELRIVVNHLGASGDPQDIHPEWKASISELSNHENVWVKVSGLVEQVRGEGPTPSDTEYYLPVLDHLWSCFGEDRLIYGSNWPVSDRAATYDVVFKIVQEYFGGKGEQAAEKYFWRNSLAAYRWIERA